MRSWDADRVAAAAGARVVRGHGLVGPARVVIDSRAVSPGDLFVGLSGARAEGGAFARGALESGAWGVLVAPRWVQDLPARGVVLAAEDPLAALGALARSWRRELGAAVIAVTGSVGKTSTKDLIAALVEPHRSVAASRANFNTEIGMPLEILATPAGTEVLVLEAAMRGFGQIAQLTAICEPDVGVITNVGPGHLEQVGSLEGVARAKGELLEGMRDGATAVVPAGEPLLDPYLRAELEVVRFGEGGDVRWASESEVVAGGERLAFELPFSSRHQRLNTLAAVAAALAVDVRPSGRVDVRFADLRGERIELAVGATVINDCYNASPLSVRAALDELADEHPEGRRIAVLGDMLELGTEEERLHREIGAVAADAGVDVLVTVGPRAAAMLDTFDGESYAVADAGEAAALAGELIERGDIVLVKASRGVGLEVVAEALVALRGSSPAAGEPRRG
jgi:UDP-N-acetylmuramoyl-tripeptide--D-alanyl-D-alanine ligase